MADESKRGLPDWVGWTSRAQQDPREHMPHFDSSDFYRKLAAPPSEFRSLTACCWTDLLGFGQSLTDADWHPSADVWKSLHERITDAHLCCFHNLDLATETVLALNDGIVRCLNLGLISNPTFVSMWLRACIFTHNWINDRESHFGLPGARSVLSCGEAFAFSHPEFRMRDFIIDSTKQPISTRIPEYDNFASQLIVIHPPQLQLNLAFSRAYLLDQAGSRHGIKGPHFYIDQTVIDVLSAEATGQGKDIFDDEQAAGRLFAIKGDREGFYSLGLLLERPPIPLVTSRLSTTVWRVLAYCPWDEPQPFGLTVT